MRQRVRRDSHKDFQRTVNPAEKQTIDASSFQTSQLTAQERVLRMQQTHGNAAVVRMLAASKAQVGVVQRGWIDEAIGEVGDTVDAITRNKKVVTLGTERVEVANDDEAKEAQRIIDTIQT